MAPEPDPFDPYDPDLLRVPIDPAADPSAVPPAPPSRPPRHRGGEKFLKGPVPFAWLAMASRLPGKALAVGVVLWQSAGYRRCRTVRLNQSRVDEMDIPRRTTQRAVQALEHAGLVAVARVPGRALSVTLLDVPAATKLGGGKTEAGCPVPRSPIDVHPGGRPDDPTARPDADPDRTGT
jgi:hypothetical protein